ncbi:MAG: lipoprotein-releasing ABC transporter permease subunit [Alphaproteobacteria bacterium]|nr:lipoprotein-releasing ABC transporter permease subunit [Alphaproteobacteria bacterium]
MIGTFELTVALRYLKSRRQEGFISVTAGFSLVGICLGVGALIIVMSVMNGFRHELITQILGFKGHVTIVAPAGGLADYDALASDVAAHPDVILAAPVVEGQVLASSRRAHAGVIVRGLTADDLAAKPLIADNMIAGSLDGSGIIAGSRLMRRLGLKLGDSMTLLSPRGLPTALGTMPRSVSWPVVGVFEVGMYEFDSGVVFVPFGMAQTYFRLEDRVTEIEVMVTLPEEPTATAADIRRIVADTGLPGVVVVDWQQTNRHLYGALQVERDVMFLILTLIILVAAFNIISSLILLVKDKNGDIAIMRTMGATRSSVMRIFLLTGSAIGIAGTLAGAVIGVLFCLHIEEIRQLIQTLIGLELFPAEVYFLSRLPARLDWPEVVTISLMALGLAFLASLYPAWRAARIEPADALRYE